MKSRTAYLVQCNRNISIKKKRSEKINTSSQREMLRGILKNSYTIFKPLFVFLLRLDYTLLFFIG